MRTAYAVFRKIFFALFLASFICERWLGTRPAVPLPFWHFLNGTTARTRKNNSVTAHSGQCFWRVPLLKWPHYLTRGWLRERKGTPGCGKSSLFLSPNPPLSLFDMLWPFKQVNGEGRRLLSIRLLLWGERKCNYAKQRCVPRLWKKALSFSGGWQENSANTQLRRKINEKKKYWNLASFCRVYFLAEKNPEKILF